MTTCLAVKKGGVISLSTDTRTTCENAILSHNDTMKNGKVLIHQNDHYFSMCGRSAGVNFLEDFLTRFKSPLTNRIQVWNMWCSFLDFLLERKARSIAKDIELLLVNPYGIYHCFVDRSVIEFTELGAVGSGAPWALGAASALYTNDWEASAISARAVEIACKHDAYSGMPVMTHVIPLKKRVTKIFSLGGSFPTKEKVEEASSE